MNFMKKRKQKKEIKEYLHAARHARNMREDIAEASDLQALDEAEAELNAIAASGEGSLSHAFEKLAAATEVIYPSKLTTGTREMVEVVIVALGAAMAIRAFFFQPYKIPTGSMQPTLNGIIAKHNANPSLLDRQPFMFVKWLLTGESYKEIRAKTSGIATQIYPDRKKNATILVIDGTKHVIPASMSSELAPIVEKMQHRIPVMFQKGDIIAQASLHAGDHIIVNKMKYNFMKPTRGDISVFDTRHITHPDVRKDTFYIKRMVGMPNEKIQIKDNRLLANGKFITEPEIFKTIDTDPTYSGHTSAGQLSTTEGYIQLGDDEYLMMGDNTKNSLDGRYFGGVHFKDFQGPAFFVYWPFGKHWGLVH